jgi:WD40 repeat protein
MIRVWDARTGQVVAGPFAGHTNWLYSVTFSPVLGGISHRPLRITQFVSGML